MLDYLTILRMHYSQNLSFREIGAENVNIDVA